MNTIGTSTIGTSWRAKYFSTNLQRVLRKALVAEKVCLVDNSDVKYIYNPFTTQPVAAIQAIAGTYSPSAWSITDDSLTVTDEIIYSGQVFDFERVMSNYDLMAQRMDEMSYAIAYGIDNFVVNQLCEDSSSTYLTPTGGFTVAANIPVIISNLCSKVMGYAETYNGLFLILESTDITGFIQAQMQSGFSYADAALNNGFLTSYGGVDVYVVRPGSFITGTIGTRSDLANSGCRVFGVKNMATYCTPRGVQYEEKPVSGKTGREIVAYGYLGFRFWSQKQALGVKVTLA